MIKGHEIITCELSEGEINLAYRLIPSFKNRTKDNPVKSFEIVAGVNKVYNTKKKFTDVRLRKIINFYRVNSILPVISTSSGYYVSYEKKDIDDMILSLSQRAGSIFDCAIGLKRILNNSKNGK